VGRVTSRLEVAVRKSLPGFTLDVEWSAGDGVAALFGPSGAGKTLTLQCLAGLVRPDAGRIVVDGQVLFDSAAGIDVAPQRRHVGYVFQGYALFPHLSVRDNVGFGLRERGRIERRRREDEVMARLGLEVLAERRPRELSGGQRQRVALGRALATDPALLLLDEPLSALDLPLRHALRDDLREVLTGWGIAAVLVTHDLTEAYRLGDRIVVYEEGRVIQAAPRACGSHRPATWPASWGSGTWCRGSRSRPPPTASSSAGAGRCSRRSTPRRARTCPRRTAHSRSSSGPSTYG
jgi:molybdate transport system ATP-binding protein